VLLNNIQSNGYFTLKFIGSVFHTLEQEHFDIFTAYEVDSNIGSDTYGDVATRGIGSQLITLEMI
jgi:hypothetical protein